jgi:CDP-diacylglycerol--glycerol-3-phosphate 3-phosphatidyltransferase
MNLANRLTTFRIVATVFFVMAILLPTDGFVHRHFPFTRTVALAIFVVASLTDWLDGYVARKRGQKTNLGGLLDPVADKILTTAAFICFIEVRAIPSDSNSAPIVQGWMVLVIVSRDFLIMGLRLIAREQGVVLSAEQLGKHKTVSQMATIIFILTGMAARDDWNWFGMDGAWWNVRFSSAVLGLMLVTVALTVISGVAYLYKYRKLFMENA